MTDFGCVPMRGYIVLYTTRTGAAILGMKQNTLSQYAVRFGIGTQPGGHRTPLVFTKEDILSIRNRFGKVKYKHKRVEKGEDRVALGLGALYNDDGSPRS